MAASKSWLKDANLLPKIRDWALLVAVRGILEEINEKNLPAPSDSWATRRMLHKGLDTSYWGNLLADEVSKGRALGWMRAKRLVVH